MATDIYWIPSLANGRLAIMPRPRGGDWLEDEVRAWRSAGVDVIVSLLTSDEIDALDLGEEEPLCQAQGLQFLSFPIIDRSVPTSKPAVLALVTKIVNLLAEHKSIAIHCRQGIGRAGLIVACVLVYSGFDLEAAVQRISSARCCDVPETSEQRRWIAQFASELASRGMG
jgi:protein-tyrosine phosphatase